MTVMLRGSPISLRTVLPDDLDELYQQHIDVAQRGPHYPLTVDSYVAYRKTYEENGFWGKDSGMLVMVDDAGVIVGDISYFQPSYFDAWEIAYRLYDPEGGGGRGVTTAALRLLCDYLFASTTKGRIQLGIHPDNAASGRVAEKAGFTKEATLRRAFSLGGTVHDIDIWALLRSER